MTEGGAADAWLSPTSAARLLGCRASVAALPGGPAPPAPKSVPGNAGSLAHLAVQRWAARGEWDCAASGELLAEQFERVAAEYGVTVAELRDGRATHARLRLRGPELSALLHGMASSPADVHPEVTLHDPRHRLWGTVDLLVRGHRTSLVDLKSGRDAAQGGADDAITCQLAIYAALVASTYSAWPTSVGYFSLVTGYHEIPLTPADAQALIARITAARTRWMAGDRDPAPAPGRCRFCRQRISCDAHWAEMAAWDSPGAVEGTVASYTAAQTNKVSVLLQTMGGGTWVTHLSPAHLAGLTPGDSLRATFVKPSGRDSEGRVTSWRATELTDVRTSATAER